MIRFESTDNGSTTIITVAGGLKADHLAELEAHCADARQTVVFDLAELQSADQASIRWLCDHIRQGHRVTGASPYIGLRLERESADHQH